MKTTLLYMAAASLTVVAGSVQADPASSQARGKMLYESRCIACHSLDSNRTGPAHRGVFGRRAGMVPGYDYSPALKASGLVWTKKNLDLWLTDPEKLVPGQKMGYSVTDAIDRRDLVAYLKSLGKDGPRRSRPKPPGTMSSASCRNCREENTRLLGRSTSS